MGKIADKVIAKQVHRLPVFHELQYGSRPGWNAIDCQAACLSIAERCVRNSGRATLLGKDIVSAFNNLTKETVMDTLTRSNAPPHLTRYIDEFLNASSSVGWDDRDRGTAYMN